MTGLASAMLLQVALLTTGAQPYEAALKDHQETGKPLLVLVGADWCPACVKMKTATMPQLERNGKLKRVAFSVVNTDHDKKVAGGMMKGGSIPQLILFTKNAKGEWEREQLNGAQSEQAIEKMINAGVARTATAQLSNKTTSVER